MKFHEFFSQTLEFIGCKSRYSYEFTITFREGDPAEMLSITRVEAAKCSAYLEKLFREPRVDRNMRKIIRSIQESVERILVLFDMIMDPTRQVEPTAGSRHILTAIEYIKPATVVVLPVLELLVDLFSRFMDIDNTMPLFYYIDRAGKYLDQWERLSEDKQFCETIREELHWLKAPFKFDETGEAKADLTYREVFELEAILLETYEILYSESPEKDTLKKLRAHLWNSNLNIEEYAEAIFRREIKHLEGLTLQEQIIGMVTVINRVRRRKRVTHKGIDDDLPLKDNVMRKLMDHLDGLKMSYTVSDFLRDAAKPDGHPKRMRLNLKPEKLGYLLRYLQEHKILEAPSPAVLLHFVSTFFQSAAGEKYDVDALYAAYRTTPVMSEHNVKRILDPRQ